MPNDLLIKYSLSLLGLPYRWGGDDTIKGFDCSGLVQEIMEAFGADPKGDQTAQGLFNWCVDSGFPSVYRPGALVFYGQSDFSIGHVGMLLNNDIMIEAGGGNSRTKTPEDAARRNAFVRLRPYDYRRDFKAVFYPRYPKSRILEY